MEFLLLLRLPAVLLPLLTVLARLPGRDSFSGSLSNADTVQRTPANGEKMVLTHMSKRVQAMRAAFFTVVRLTLVIFALGESLESFLLLLITDQADLVFCRCSSGHFYTKTNRMEMGQRKCPPIAAMNIIITKRARGSRKPQAKTHIPVIPLVLLQYVRALRAIWVSTSKALIPI